MKIVPDPFGSGQMDQPDTVVVNSASQVPSAPWSGHILIPEVFIPNWGDEETVAVGGGGLPSAASLGLKINWVTVPNDGSHGDGDVISLSPPAGSLVPIGSIVTVTIWGRSPDTVVIPNWGDEETVAVGEGGLPSAASLGLKINWVIQFPTTALMVMVT